MKENILWDKKISIGELKEILRDASHPRFIYFASLLLSRTNNIKEVFDDYLDKVMFCKNWRKIKQKMRKNKWGDKRIDFWDEVYRVTLQTIDKTERQVSVKRDEFVNEELKEMGTLLRKTRKKMGWTQKKLGENIGLSQQTISFIEKGNFDFSFGSLLKIISALNLKVSIEPRTKYTNGTGTATPYFMSFRNISTQE